MLAKDRESLGEYLNQIGFTKEQKETRTKEEVEYLKQSGVIAVFKDAAKVLRKSWRDAQVFGIKPDNNEPVSVNLCWSFSPVPGYVPTWECQAVRAKVLRNDDGKIEGIELTPGLTIHTPNQEKIGSTLLTVIKHPTTLKTRHAPSLIEGLLSHLPLG